MIASIYKSVMDPHSNPLSNLPKYVRFQIMTVLSIMWTTIFSLWTGMTYLFGPSVVAHMLLALGVIFTAEVFRYAKTMTRVNTGVTR
ncbi:MAG: hypothetical protein ACJZ9F_11095 [Rhodospirillaceae bacterium]